MIISVDAEIHLTKFYTLHDKNLRSMMQGRYLDTIKAIYSNTLPRIKLNGEKLKTIPLKSGTKQAFHSPHVY